jgi:hypothetical protein
MKSSRKIVIAIIIGLGLLLFGVASSMSVATHTGAVRQPYPTAVEY